MSFFMIPMACEDCEEKWQTSFGIVGSTQIASPTVVCPKCGSKKIKNIAVYLKGKAAMSETVGQGITEALNSALDNPPFDPTPTEAGMYNDLQDGPYVRPVTSDPQPKYTIKVRQLGEYPESGQSLDSAAWAQSNVVCPPEPSLWQSLFGPTKANLRREIERLKDERDKNLTTYASDLWDLRKQITSLQKLNKDYQFSVRAKDEKITSLLEHLKTAVDGNDILQRNLNAANEEIMRMTPPPMKKRGRPKKAGKK